LTGLGLVIFGSLGDFAALSMVAQSIVAPLASTTLVTNVIFAHFWSDRVARAIARARCVLDSDACGRGT
jgi:dihydrodipicolinate synthase/N-acetylneuraminate lyase